MHSAEEGGTFEKSPGVLLFEGEELPGGLSELGEGELNSPDLSFIFESILSNKLKLVIDSFLFEGSPGGFECSGI